MPSDNTAPPGMMLTLVCPETTGRVEVSSDGQDAEYHGLPTIPRIDVTDEDVPGVAARDLTPVVIVHRGAVLLGVAGHADLPAPVTPPPVNCRRRARREHCCRRDLAHAAEALGRNQVAIQSYQTLLLLEPPDPTDAHFRLAQLLHQDAAQILAVC